jgi:tricorn protease-like protein
MEPASRKQLSMKNQIDLSKLVAFLLILSAFCAMCGARVIAQQGSKAAITTAAVSFEREISSIFHHSCIGCHSSATKMGGLVLESYESLMKGGHHGPAIVPGKSIESRLVLMIEGRIEPRMPMSGTLKASEIAAIKAWIDAGAVRPERAPEASAGTSNPVIPDIKPIAPVLVQANALAFRPDGAILAASGYKEVRLVDLSRGEVTSRLTGPSEMVRGLAYSADGKYLAATGGRPGEVGEAVMWDTKSGQIVHTLKGHNDYIYSAAFSPDGLTLATSSYDRLIKLWDVASGAEVMTLKDHIDAVYPIAFSPDGKRLASGAADRSVKIWDATSGKRLFTLSDSTDAVYTLAFHPSGDRIAAGGADRIIRIWSLAAQGGALLHSITAHEDSINRIAYSPDGRWLASAGADGRVKIWDAITVREIKVLEKQPDWVQGLSISADGKLLAISIYDGSVKIYETSNWQQVMMPIRGKDGK